MALVDTEKMNQLFAQENKRMEKVTALWEKEGIDKSLEKMAPIIVEVVQATSGNLRNKSKLSGVKKIVRQGIPPKWRPEIWSKLLMVEDKIEAYNRSYDTGMRRAFGEKPPDKYSPPTFGGTLPQNLLLTQQGTETANYLLGILKHDFSDVEYCPFLPSLVYLLLHFASPSQTLGISVCILKAAKKARHWAYFPIGRKETTLVSYVFVDEVKRLMPRLHAFVYTFPDAEEGWPAFWEEIFERMFIGFLPLSSIFRILDCLFFEGIKVFFRVGLGLLKVMERYAYSCETSLRLMQTLKRELFASEGPRFEELLKAGFAVHVNRSGLTKSKFQNTSHVSQILMHYTEIALPEKPELSEPSEILTDSDLVMIWGAVPFRLRISNLEVIYKSRTQGHALSKFYAQTGSSSPTILAIKTMKGETFGAYLSHPWSQRKPKTFFGNGECFLFRLGGARPALFTWVKTIEPGPQRHALSAPSSPLLSPKGAPLSSSSIQEDAQIGQISRHAPTTDAIIPDYFMLGEHSFLAVGGGEGKFALWIDSDLRFGRTESCPTFDNEPLASQEHFEILEVEVFAFV